MTKGSKLVRMDIEDYHKLEEKRKRMKNTAEVMLCKPVKLPFTKFIKLVANNPVEITDNNLKRVIKVRKKHG